jgi:arsenate reductase
MNKAPYKVLILCTGNSARSIIAEYLLRAKGKGRFETFSAGSHPTGRVNPLAVWVLHDRYGMEVNDARSKSWDEFKGIAFDFVITVCDNAKESCPIFPGHPLTAHFGVADPAGVQGSEDEQKRAFIQAASQLSRRLDLFCALPDDQLMQAQIRAIPEQAQREESSQ